MSEHLHRPLPRLAAHVVAASIAETSAIRGYPFVSPPWHVPWWLVPLAAALASLVTFAVVRAGQ